jgi:HCOMODA/2-hydroxy-3-carboxy-muconic semialdehyde decarboxylase
VSTASATDAAIGDLALANHILDHEGVLDAFGHVSARHPVDPQRYLLSRARSPGMVTAADVYEFTLDSQPVREAPVRHYAERVIHGEILRARPDVHAVCHLHSEPVLPFAVSGTPLVPVFHMGAVIGRNVGFWDARDEFGDTDMLVSTPQQAQSLAHALGPNWTVLMRRHGAVVVGRSIREVVFRAVQLKLNAALQLRAAALGDISPLTDREIDLACEILLSGVGLERSWEYWCARAARGEQSFS